MHSLIGAKMKLLVRDKRATVGDGWVSFQGQWCETAMEKHLNEHITLVLVRVSSNVNRSKHETVRWSSGGCVGLCRARSWFDPHRE